MDISVIDLVIALVVTAFAAAVQSTVGFGFAVVSVPILALVDGSLVPVPQLLMAIPLVGAMAWRERKDVDLGGIGWIISGRVIGGVIGLVLLKVLSDTALEIVIGVVVLILVLAVVSGIRPELNRANQLGGGAVSGVTGMIASMGGPPLSLLYREEPGAKMRSSLAVVFLFGIAITLSLRIVGSEIAWSDVWIAVALLPALFVGFVLAGRLLRYVEGEVLRAGVVVVSVLAAGGLILRALLGG